MSGSREPSAAGHPPEDDIPAPYSQPPYARPVVTSEERTWAWVSHAGCFVGAAVAMAFLVPLVIMLTKGKESAYVRRHAVESLNFQLSVLVYAAVSALLTLVVIGLFLLLALAILYVVVVVIATVKAAAGEEYRYPLTLRFVS
jgi:uncharacterized Tic20 family protein